MAAVLGVIQVIKEYWFLITLVMSAAITVAYMIVFRVNPWDTQRSVKLRRGQVRFHNSVGTTLLEEGRYKAAKTEFEEALKLVPEDQMALNGRYLTELFLAFDSPDWDPAVGLAIQRHLEQIGPIQQRVFHIAQKYLGDLHERIGKPELKKGFYEKALAHKPDYTDALYSLGWTYYSDLSDPDGMEHAFRQMVNVNPYDYRGLHGLGYALYMKAVREPDENRRAGLLAEAATQSGLAKNLRVNQLNIVMDFGEIARSDQPDVSLYFHERGKQIVEDPTMNQLGDNPFGLAARLLAREGQVYIENSQQKLAWIEYQIALDYLALQRKGLQTDAKDQHAARLKNATSLDPGGSMLPIYLDQLAILDRFVPQPTIAAR